MVRVMKGIVLKDPLGKVTGDEPLSQKARSRLDDLSL